MEFIDLQLFVAALAGAFLIALAMIMRVVRSSREGRGKAAVRVPKSPSPQHSLPIADEQQAADRPPPARRRGLDAIKSDAVAVPADYYGEVEGKLEDAFEQFYGGRIGLLAYSALVRAEEQSVCRHIARLRELRESRRIDADTFEYELGIAELALQAIRWCINWAEGHGNAAAGSDRQPPPHDPAELGQACTEQDSTPAFAGTNTSA